MDGIDLHAQMLVLGHFFSRRVEKIIFTIWNILWGLFVFILILKMYPFYSNLQNYMNSWYKSYIKANCHESHYYFSKFDWTLIIRDLILIILLNLCFRSDRRFLKSLKFLVILVSFLYPDNAVKTQFSDKAFIYTKGWK